MRLMVATLCISLILLFCAGCYNARMQELNCCLCKSVPQHAPCIVNLSTGRILELQVYESDPFAVAELAQTQREGYFFFLHDAGVEGYIDGARQAKVHVPKESAPMNPQYFCAECTEILSDYLDQGFALVDTANLASIKAYPIEDGAAFSVRCYDITVSLTEDAEKYEVTVVSTLETE